MKVSKLTKSDKLLISLYAAVLAVNLAARVSVGFSDFYVQRIYPYISLPFIALSGLFPFSIGELMIALTLAALIIGIFAYTVILIKHRKDKQSLKQLDRRIIRCAAWIILYIFTTETFGCFVMYQCSTFSSKYFVETKHTEELLLDTLSAVSQGVISLSGDFERGSDGYIVLDEDCADECRAALARISAEYPQLSGYYPKPKKVYFSFFMSQQGIIGLYMPFAFEATYNRDPQDISKPCTICHELAHLKGIIQEDEASFVAIVACLSSDSKALRYSGYLDAFYYLYSNASELIGTEYEEGLRKAIRGVPDEVWDYDLYSFKKNYWEENKDKEIIPTEAVQAVSEALTDANLKLNDVKDGIKAYYRVTELLMDYRASGGL